ncbi:hypothetical protein BH10PLA2_BH10PLA2_12230 [soil metagenome]
MPHHAKPFFHSGRGWYVQLGKHQVKLADGPQNSESEAAAWIRYHEVMNEHLQASAPEKKSANSATLTVVEILDKYLAWCQKHRAIRTYEWYHDHIQDFINYKPEVARLPFCELKPFHVVEWVDSHGDSWSPAYRRGAIVAMQRPFNWADEMGYIPNTPIRKIAKPTPQRREQSVTPEQWEQIKSHYPDGDPFRDLLEFAWETGCRPQEVRVIEARHIDQSQHRVFFEKIEAKGKKHARAIYLTPRAEEILQRHSGQEGFLFRNEDGEPWTRQAIACRFGRLEKHTGVKFCATALRHGFGTRKLMEGHDHLVIAELMGHRDGRMLAQTYQHLDQHGAHLRKVLESRSNQEGRDR